MTQRFGIFAGGTLALLMLAGYQDVTGNANAQSAATADVETWIGNKLNEHATIVGAEQCLGSFDLANSDPTDSSRSMVLGWAWNPEAGKVPQTILLASADDTIIGYAATGVSRPDVPNALPEVTSEESGWSGSVTSGGDDLTAYALLGGDEACPLPRGE